MAPYDVSVCITSYYHEPYIRQALESVLAQKTNFSYEICVSDDCSGDGTYAILQEYADRNPDIHIQRHEENVGLTANVFSVRCMAQGRYIVHLSGDDYYIDEHKLQKQYDFLETHPEFFAVCTRIEVRVEDSAKRHELYPPMKYCGREFTLDMFLKGMEDGRNAPPFFLEDPLPEGLGRSEIKAYGKTVLEKCLDKMVPELGKNLGIPHVRYSLDCPGKAFGLCSRDGLIRLNPFLVWMRRDVLREAVLHEMNHLLMQSEGYLFTEHPPAFWENLTRLEPMWPYLEGWMRGRRRAGRKHGICV